jgi:hypothetical protein
MTGFFDQLVDPDMHPWRGVNWPWVSHVEYKKEVRRLVAEKVVATRAPSGSG